MNLKLDAVLEQRTSVSITDPSGLALTSTSISNATGQTSSSIDASGRVAETTFDAQGRAVETTADPSGLALTASTTYDLLGRAITSTDAEGIITRYQYDNLGRLRVVFENYVSGQSDSSWPACQYDIDSINVCTRYAYDDAGNLTSTVLGSGSGTTYTYDARGQMKLETVDPGGENIATAYTYDAAGSQVTLIRDPAGTPQPNDPWSSTTFHDRLGRATGVDYVGTASDVVYSYDAWGNRASMLDAGGTWNYTYDAMSHLTSVTNPQSIEVAYEYDPTGNRTDLDLPGMSVDYTFDNAGRLDTVSNPFGTGVVDYDYDDTDMTKVELPNGTSTTNSYDTAGRLEQILNAAGAEALSTFLYTLDDRGNRTDAAETLTTPGGGLMSVQEATETPPPTPAPTVTSELTSTPTTTPTETPATAPTATVSPTPAATPTVTETPAQTPTALPTETPAETPTPAPTVTLPETATPEATPTQTPTAISAESQALLSLLAEEGEHNWHYQYDGLSRVTYACSDWTGTACAPTGHEFHYAYDGSGNLLRFDKWNASTNTVETVRYVINGANQITCVDTDASDTCNGSETVWEYDAFGNLLSDGTTQYAYDAANRVASITAAGVTTTYTYNGDGDRISQSVNGTLITYLLDTATPLTMVLAESTGGVTTRYWHGLDTLAQSDGTSVEYFAYDGLGSVRQLVGESGSVGLAQTFDPYGNGYSKAGSAGSSFGYSGEQVDANGFVFLRARYYNPAYGRFFQRDTFRGSPNYPLTLNPYMFVLGNPILHTDFSGRCVDGITTFACVAVGIIVGTIIGGVGARLYAEWMYQWALTGECGCDKQAWALQVDKNRYMMLMTTVGAVLGGLAGGIGATGGLALILVGGFGFILSSIQIIGAFIDAQHNQWNPCNMTDLALGIVGAVLSFTAMAKGVQQEGGFAALVDRGKAFFLSKQPLPPPSGAGSTTGSTVGGTTGGTATTASAPPRGVSFPKIRSLQHEQYWHGKDFGVTGKWDNSLKVAFMQAIEAHVNNPSNQQIVGTYQHQPAIFYYNPTTNVTVFTYPDGSFWGGWLFAPGQVAGLLASGNVW